MAETKAKSGSKTRQEAEEKLGMPIYKWCEENCQGMSRHEASEALSKTLIDLGCSRIPKSSSLWNFIKSAQEDGLTEYNFIGKRGRRKASEIRRTEKQKKVDISDEMCEIENQPDVEENIEVETNEEDDEKLIPVEFIHRDNSEICFTEEIPLGELKDHDSRIVACRSHGETYNPVYVANFKVNGQIYRRAMVGLPNSGIKIESFVDENLKPIANPFAKGTEQTDKTKRVGAV